MKTTHNRFPWPLFVAIAAVAIATGFGLGSNVSHPPVIRESEETIVNKALDIYGHGKVSREALREHFHISVVYLPTMTCVGLNLKGGTAGRDETMCFDKSGERLVLQYREGD